MLRFPRRIALLFRTLWRGLRADPDSAAIGFLLSSLLAIGTMFYHFAEGWGWIDSLYFCVMTAATVGFGDFTPTSPMAKIFTIGFTFLGIGLFASFVGKVAFIWLHIHKEERK